MLTQDVDTTRVVRSVAVEFNVSERTVRLDVARIETAWAEVTPWESPRVTRAKRKRVLEALYRKCLRDGDNSAAVAVQDKLCKIDGVYAPESVSVTAAVGVTSIAAAIAALPSSQQRGRLAELMAKALDDQRGLTAIDVPTVEPGSTAPRPRMAAQASAAPDDDDDEPRPALPEARAHA